MAALHGKSTSCQVINVTHFIVAWKSVTHHCQTTTADDCTQNATSFAIHPSVNQPLIQLYLNVGKIKFYK